MMVVEGTKKSLRENGIEKNTERMRQHKKYWKREREKENKRNREKESKKEKCF